jgi:hypothetical protein
MSPLALLLLLLCALGPVAGRAKRNKKAANQHIKHSKNEHGDRIRRCVDSPDSPAFLTGVAPFTPSVDCRRLRC